MAMIGLGVKMGCAVGNGNIRRSAGSWELALCAQLHRLALLFALLLAFPSHWYGGIYSVGIVFDGAARSIDARASAALADTT